jgi:hypothetical protein
MRKAKNLLQAMNDIDDTFLIEAEETLAQQKQTRKSPFKWFVIVLAILGISASAYAAMQWTPYFMDYFHPTAGLISKTEDNVQSVQAIAEYDDLTLRIEQTIGDEHSLYVQLEIILPEGQTWRDVLPQDLIEENGERYFFIQPECNFFSGNIPYDEIKHLSMDEIDKRWWEQDTLYSSASISGIDFNLENSYATYVLYFHSPEKDLTEEELTLIIPYLKASQENVYEGPWAITWQPKNQGEQYEFILRAEDDNPIGKVYVSSFLFDISYNYKNRLIPESMQKDYKNLKEFQEDIYFNFTDGTKISLRSLTSDRMGTFEDYWVSCKAMFNPILNLDTVASIQVGPYLCELK